MEGLGVSMETLIGNMVGYVQVPPPGGPQVCNNDKTLVLLVETKLSFERAQIALY